jgi:hypothetical protein
MSALAALPIGEQPVWDPREWACTLERHAAKIPGLLDGNTTIKVRFYRGALGCSRARRLQMIGKCAILQQAFVGCVFHASPAV